MTAPVRNCNKAQLIEEDRQQRFHNQGYNDYMSDMKSPRWTGHRYLKEYMEGWEQARKKAAPYWWERLFIKVKTIFN